MTAARRLILSVVCGVMSLFQGCFVGTPHEGEPLEIWETSNERVTVRVTEIAEEGAYLNGTYYRYESAHRGSAGWRKIFTVRHDDRPRIARNQVRFVTGEITYVFMIDRYAVTTDGGLNWSVWSSGDLPNQRCCTYPRIEKVIVNADGSGIMELGGVPSSRVGPSRLVTNDLGVHWVLK